MAKVSGNRFFGEGGSPSESAAYKRSKLAGSQRKAVIRIGALEKGLVEIDDRVTVVEANSFIDPGVFKDINSTLLGISGDLNAIQNLIVEDTKIDVKAADADKLQTDRDKDKQRKLNKEGFLERGQGALNALKGGAKTVASGVRNTFASFFEALTLVFSGWMIDKLGDAIAAWNEGDTDALKGIAAEVGKALGVLGGVFLAVNIGVPLVTTILTNLGWRLLFGGGAAAGAGGGLWGAMGGFAGISAWFSGTLVPFLSAVLPWVLLIAGIGAATWWGVGKLKEWREGKNQKRDEKIAGARWNRLRQEGEVFTETRDRSGEWGFTERMTFGERPPWHKINRRRAYDKQLEQIKKYYDQNPYWFLKDMPGHKGKGSDDWKGMEMHKNHIDDRIATLETIIESLKASANPGDKPHPRQIQAEKQIAELKKVREALVKQIAKKPKADEATRLSSLQQIQLDEMASRLARSGMDDDEINKKLLEFVKEKGWVVGQGQKLRYQSKTKTKDEDELKIILSDVVGSFVDGEVVTGAFGKETGVVKSYDANNNELILINRTGAFTNDETLVGSQSKAKGVATSLTGNILGENKTVPIPKELNNNNSGGNVDEISSATTSNKADTISKISTDTSSNPSIEIVPIPTGDNNNNNKTPLVASGESTVPLILLTNNDTNDYTVHSRHAYGIEVA